MDTHGTLQVRRATVEDLPALRELWRSHHLAAPQLEKRFTEFQVVADPEGGIRGAAGLRVERLHGLIHSEAYAHAGDETAFRPVLWERIQRIARNSGLIRLWTRASASFYREQGMVEMDPPASSSFPPGFGDPEAAWLTLKLRDETSPQLSIEQEFQLFAQSQREESEGLMRRARFFRLAAYALLALVFAALGWLAVVVFKRMPARPPSRTPR